MDGTIWQSVRLITEWLDGANSNNPLLTTEQDDALRILKLGEEIGEVNQAFAEMMTHEMHLRMLSVRFGQASRAYIGMTGQNPRKGVTHSKAQVLAELADCALTALCAIHHFTGDEELTRRIFATKLGDVKKRLPSRDLPRSVFVVPPQTPSA
jgi:hypothetical protein